MRLKQWFRSQSDGVRAAIISGIPVLLVGIIAAAAAIISANITANSSGRPGRPTTPPVVQTAAGSPVPSSATCQSKLAITSPVDGQQVSDGSQGVQVQGTACGLSDEYAWVFDHDTEDHYYYVVSTEGPRPVTRQDGAWSVLDKPIGDPGDTRKVYYLTLVLASASCNQVLLGMQPVDGDNKVLTFPPGCQIVQDVKVFVTYPG